jgi:UDP-N-acetylmuramate: L-alanyl-gamma-D-glutamyl-meso-diaminopimelate ligase
VFVVGNVVKRGMPLMEAVLDAGARYTSGPQWLAEHVLHGRHVLAVAGTHGKTTTTAMLAWMLEQAGLEAGLPGWRRAAQLRRQRAPGQPARPSSSRPTSTTPRSSTSAASSCTTGRAPPCSTTSSTTTPTSSPTSPPSRRSSTTWCAACLRSGRIVVNARDEALARVLARGCWSEVQRFGTRREEPGGLCARGEPGSFDVLRGSLKLGHVAWELLGEHNQLNALAAIAAAEHVGVAPAAACAALGSFRNVRRRLERVGEAGGVTVYDDFAHHPSAMRTTLDGLRRKLGHGVRILAVFEPRSNTMKLGTMKAQLPWALEDADLAFGLQGDYGWKLAEALLPMGDRAVVADSVESLVAAIRRAAQPGDHVLVHEQRRLRRHPRQAALAAHIGPQTAWHDPQLQFEFTDHHVDALRRLSPGPLTDPSRYAAVIAQGDELLDWHEMAARYAGARLRIVPGSDHALSDFDDHLPFVLQALQLVP